MTDKNVIAMSTGDKCPIPLFTFSSELSYFWIRCQQITFVSDLYISVHFLWYLYPQTKLLCDNFITLTRCNPQQLVLSALISSPLHYNHKKYTRQSDTSWLECAVYAQTSNTSSNDQVKHHLNPRVPWRVTLKYLFCAETNQPRAQFD